jgi:transketolase
VPALGPDEQTFSLGTSDQVRDGDDVTVIAVGTMVSRALEAAELVRDEGISVRVVNMVSIEPLDVAAVRRAADETGRVVTVEEATVTGGLGAAVASLLAQYRPTPMRILGVPRQFAPTGSTDFLLEHFGLDAAGIASAIRTLCSHAHQ